MFTDVVGSTELRSRLGDAAADEVWHALDAAIVAAVESAGGRVVKSLGDGHMAVFESAAEAVSAGIAAQQATASLQSSLPEAVAIRVGISVGDVTFNDGDCFGSAVNEAARLCAAAQVGQILCADLVRALARGRGGFRYESFGALELKGLPEPVETCLVGWEPSRSGSTAVPFPPPLVPGTPIGYVGRPDVLGLLHEAWDATKVEGARLVLLAGEPGIGKTRTAYEVARLAAEQGALVLYGRCDDGLAVPYQPFVEALEWHTRHDAAVPLGRLAGELSRLVPDLPARIPGLLDPLVSDPSTQEHRLFEAVAAWLIATAGRQGLVLVLDDLHWSTKPTLLLLLHALRAATSSPELVRLLIVGTYRDTDVDRTHPLSAVLGDLQRLERSRRVAVDPLDLDEVIGLMELVSGHVLDDSARRLAVRAHAETEGNPFFVGEVLRHLVERGAIQFIDGLWVVPDPDDVDVPEGVRDVVGQRLSRLSDDANAVLHAASVVGRQFTPAVVGALAELGEDRVLDALDEAARARLVEETATDSYRFAHALVRTTLYDELSATRRRRMHRRVTDTLAKLAPDDVAALAHHAVLAGPQDGDLSQAIGYLVAAGDQALAARALAEAASLYEKAIELLEEDGADRLDHRAITARCAIAEIHRDQGDPAFREVLLAVGEDALYVGDDALIVRAALSNTRGTISIVAGVDEERIAQLDLARTRAAEGATRERALLASNLATELMFHPDRQGECAALVAEAVALADACGDDWTRAWVLTAATFSQLVPDSWVLLADTAQLAVEAADRTGDPNLRAQSRLFRGWCYLSEGRMAEGRAVALEGRAIAERDGTPMQRWVVGAGTVHYHAVTTGDLAQMAADNDVMLALGQQVGSLDATSWWGSVAAVGEWLRTGQLVDPDLAAHVADAMPQAHSWRLAQAAALAQRGRLDEARAVLAAHDLAYADRIPKDIFWLTTVFWLCETVYLLDDADLARAALPALEPYSALMTHFCVGVVGPLRQALSRLRLTLGDLDGAIADLRWSLDALCAAELVCHAAVVRCQLASALFQRDLTADRAEAREVAALAVEDADRLHMSGWGDLVRELLASS